MNEEMENLADTYLPTIGKDLKDVFPDFEPYFPMGMPVASTGDSAAGSILPLDGKTINDTGIDDESLFALLISSNSSFSKPSFSILPSKKERGKPYFIHDKERILTTKKNEPIHLQLDSCKPGQQILLSLRYSDQDYYDRPMVCNGCSHAYKGCISNEDHNEANFCVKSRDGSVEYMTVLEGTAWHPTAVITVAAKHELVDLFAAFKCRNSCSEHKKYGGDRTLRVVLLDEQRQELCRNEWNLRVCESAKRDHNLVLSKAGSIRSDSASVPCLPSQMTVAPPPTPAAENFFASVRAADADEKPPPMKRVKLEEETVVHYIEDAPSSTQQTGTGPTGFQYGPSPNTAYNSLAGSCRKNGNNNASPMSSGRSSGVVSVPGCFEGKPLLPIAPPAPAVAEAPAAAGVIPVMVYPKNEADKKLLLTLVERLGMDAFNVLNEGSSPNACP